MLIKMTEYPTENFDAVLATSPRVVLGFQVIRTACCKYLWPFERGTLVGVSRRPEKNLYVTLARQQRK